MNSSHFRQGSRLESPERVDNMSREYRQTNLQIFNVPEAKEVRISDWEFW